MPLKVMQPTLQKADGSFSLLMLLGFAGVL